MDPTRSATERTHAILALVRTCYLVQSDVRPRMQMLLTKLLRDPRTPLAVKIAAAVVGRTRSYNEEWDPEGTRKAQDAAFRKAVAAFFEDVTDPGKKPDRSEFVEDMGLSMLLLAYPARGAAGFARCEACGADIREKWIWEWPPHDARPYLAPPKLGPNGVGVPLHVLTVQHWCPSGHLCKIELHFMPDGRMEAASGKRRWSGRLRDEHRVAIGKWLARRRSYLSDQSTKPALVKGWIEVLAGAGPALRMNAAAALGHLATAEAIPPLCAALRDKDRDVRIAAAGALGRARRREATPALVEALRSGDPELCRRAIQALGELRDPRGAEVLIPYLERGSDRGPLASAALHALVRIGQPGVSTLIHALDMQSARVREYACCALGLIRSREAVPALIARLKDPEVSVRRRAASALGMIGDSRAFEPLAVAMGSDAGRDALYRVALRQVGASSVAAPVGPVPCREIQRAEEAVRDGGAQQDIPRASPVPGRPRRLGESGDDETALDHRSVTPSLGLAQGFQERCPHSHEGNEDQ